MSNRPSLRLNTPSPPAPLPSPPSSFDNLYAFFFQVLGPLHPSRKPRTAAEYPPSPSLVKQPTASILPISRRPFHPISFLRRRFGSTLTFLLLVSLPISVTLYILNLRQAKREEQVRLQRPRRGPWVGLEGLAGNWERGLEERFGWSEGEGYDKIEESARRGFEDWIPPPWYGSSDIHGPSPFDHIPPRLLPGQRKQRILFLTDYHDYLERMNTNTYEIIDAALRHPLVTVDVWGPKWLHYDPNTTVAENVRRRGWRNVGFQEDAVPVEVEEDGEQDRGGWRWGWRVEKDKDDWSDHYWRYRRKEAVLDTEPGITPANEAPVPSAMRTSGAKELDANTTEPEVERGPIDETVPEWVLVDEEDACGDKPFDIVWTFSDIYKQTDPMLTPLQCGSIFVQQLGDCHSLSCLREFYPYAANITVTKYSHELVEVFGWERLKGMFEGMEMGLFGVSGEGGNPWDYYPEVTPVKEAKVIAKRGEMIEAKHAAGSQSLVGDEMIIGRMPSTGMVNASVFGYEGSFYPLRTTISTAILALQTFITRFPHPGYYLWSPVPFYDHPLPTYTIHHPVYAKHEAIRADFASGLRRSRICVFDSSLERKMVRKYVQGMLSGCVVAGDFPTEHEADLEKVMIRLRPSWTIERINAELQYYLDRPELLRQKAIRGFVLARSKFSNTKKVTDMLKLVEKYQEGARGYDCTD